MKKTVAIVGGGASALMLGAEVDPAKYELTIYERNKALARKFLVAGDGGLNITHSEAPDTFLKKYSPPALLSQAFASFNNKDLVNWLQKKNIPTVVGSSKRVFPASDLKPIEVLQVLENAMLENHTQLAFQHTWTGFDTNGQLQFVTPEGPKTVRADLVILCLGGASWPVTGSKGDWLPYLRDQGITVHPFYPSNCAYQVQWPEILLPMVEGKALKNVELTCGGQSRLGEIVLTRFGIEGSGLYPLSPQIREQLLAQSEAEIRLDLKPMFSETKIRETLLHHAKAQVSQLLKTELKLSAAAIALLKSRLSKEQFLDPGSLAHAMKNLHIVISGVAPLEEAISTVGGIDLGEIDEQFQLKKLPGVYAIGEMLDYDAPTGGYLLQSCFSMAHYLASHLNKR